MNEPGAAAQWSFTPQGHPAHPGKVILSSTTHHMGLARKLAMFEKLGGARPGLRIELSEWHNIDQHAGGASVNYRELQSDASGVLNDRRATAVFERQPSGALLWRHLHETFC